LPDGGVGRQGVGVAEVALENEGEGEGHDADGGHGDEHWLEGVGADVGDVGHPLAVRHGGVVWAAGGGPVGYHCYEAGEPYC